MDSPRRTRNSSSRKNQKDPPEHQEHSLSSKRIHEQSKTPPAEEETAADDPEESSLDIGACCLCHCSLDFADKAAFSKEARFEDYDDDEGSTDSFYFRKQDPYLPIALEDSNNALVYCDSCPRLYHQQCHFVPVIHLQANKPWECLICTIQKQEQHAIASSKRAKKKSKAEPYDYEIMFRSPPIPSARPHEIRWECDPRVIAMKAVLSDRELNVKIPKMFSNSITKYKRAITALNAIASSKRNRDHFLLKSSQELVQSVITVTAAKRRIRAIFQDLEHIRCAQYPRLQWNTLRSWILQQNGQKDFIKRTMFPFGMDHARRWAPVTPEYKPEENRDSVPSQITIPKVDTPTRRSTRSSSKKVESPQPPPIPKDTGSFSLDELTCCVCLNGESSDENDMILCDGHRCFRAYHAQCVHPAIPKEVLEDEDANWFCPFCQALANSLHSIQGLTSDADEWEERREARKGNDEHDGSLASWGGPDDVFPEADREHAIALRLKQGDQDHDTKALLAKMLGLEDDANETDAKIGNHNNDNDDDDEEEDGHFDVNSYEEERKRVKEEANELSSDNSSQATLQELSSVELAIDKDELAALKVDGASTWDDDDSSNNDIGRRLRPRNAPNDSDSNIEEDPGKMSAKNILNGKRKRRQVDYRKLNDMIFGETDEKERLKLDDGEDFVSTLKAGNAADESSCSDDSQ